MLHNVRHNLNINLFFSIIETLSWTWLGRNVSMVSAKLLNESNCGFILKNTAHPLIHRSHEADSSSDFTLRINSLKHLQSVKCNDLNTQESIEDTENESNFAQYDSISTDDIVRKQYKMLPYPPVPEEKLLKERQHYMKKNYPFSIFYEMVLESLNYYLYKGNAKFRYELF